MSNKKKLISVLLVVVLMFSFTTFVAAAEPAVTEAAVEYEQVVVPFAWCCPFPNHGHINIYCPVTGLRTGRVFVCFTCGTVNPT
ncbi:MAG: hypothetical protein FWC96_07025 [Oscillospiraceae bacterium]|nr:hypothetical protein [Oscillospiraceae bacterium]